MFELLAPFILSRLAPSSSSSSAGRCITVEWNLESIQFDRLAHEAILQLELPLHGRITASWGVQEEGGKALQGQGFTGEASLA